MIIQIKQIHDKFRVMVDKTYVGGFYFGKNDIIFYDCDDSNETMCAAQAVKNIFNKQNVVIKLGKFKKIYINKIDRNPNNLTLYHHSMLKPCEYNVFDCYNRLGTAFVNRKHIIFTTDYLINSDTIADAAYKLTKGFNQNVRMIINDNILAITPQTPYTQVRKICDTPVRNWYYGGEMVGTYKYAEQGIDFTPLTRVPLGHAVNGAVNLVSFTGKNVRFICQNNTESLLFNLYKRKLCKKRN